MLTGMWNLKDFKIHAKTVIKINWSTTNAVTRAHGSCSLRVMGFSDGVIIGIRTLTFTRS